VPLNDLSGGPRLGFLEHLLFFVGAWVPNAYLLEGAWLAFKVASKWYGWQHIIQVPGGEPKLTLDDRHKLGSWTTSRFLLGTIYNALAGIAVREHLRALALELRAGYAEDVAAGLLKVRQALHRAKAGLETGRS